MYGKCYVIYSHYYSVMVSSLSWLFLPQYNDLHFQYLFPTDFSGSTARSYRSFFNMLSLWFSFLALQFISTELCIWLCLFSIQVYGIFMRAGLVSIFLTTASSVYSTLPGIQWLSKYLLNVWWMNKWKLYYFNGL